MKRDLTTRLAPRLGLLLVLALAAVASLAGCVAPRGDVALLKAVADDVSVIKVEQEKIAENVALIQENNTQTQGPALVNIASAGGGLWASVVATALAVVCWRLERARRYWKKHAGCMADEIEKSGNGSAIKTALAKRVSRETPFGQHVNEVTCSPSPKKETQDE